MEPDRHADPYPSSDHSPYEHEMSEQYHDAPEYPVPSPTHTTQYSNADMYSSPSGHGPPQHVQQQQQQHPQQQQQQQHSQLSPPQQQHQPSPHMNYITHYPSSTDYGQMPAPPSNVYHQTPTAHPQPGYDLPIPLNVESYASYPTMNAGPSTPAAVHTQHRTTASTSSRESSTSSPMTPSSIHSPLGTVGGHSTHSNGGSLVHRQPLRSHSHSSSQDGSQSGDSIRKRKGRGRNDDDDSDGDELEVPGSVADSIQQRREDARRQRQNAEQRRRDQLRDGYDRLQSVLPAGKDKMSKVRLIDFAMKHIQSMSLQQQEYQARILELERERDNLRQRNEDLARQLSSARPGETANIPPPPPSSIPSSTNIAIGRPPSHPLPVPLSGTGPPGQQRHTMSYTHGVPSHRGAGGPLHPGHSSVRTDGIQSLSINDEGRDGADVNRNGVPQAAEGHAGRREDGSYF